MPLTDEKRKLLSQLFAQSQASRQAPQTTSQPQKKGGRGGFLTSLISETLGTVGGIGGFALAGPVGAGIGAAGLGSLGSALEQKVRDDKVDWGKAGKEGAIEGVFSAGPLKLGKLAINLPKAAKAAKAGGSFADELSQALISIPTKAGRSLTASARGMQVGARAGDTQLRSPELVNELNTFLSKTVKTKAAAPARQLVDLEKFIKKRGEDLGKVLQKANRTLTEKEKTTIVTKMRGEFNNAVVAPTNRQLAIMDDIEKRIHQAPDLVSVDTLRKTLDSNIKKFSADANLPLDEQVFRIGRRSLTEEVGERAGLSKAVKKDLNQAFTAEDFLFQSAGRKTAAATPGGIPIPRRLAQGVSARAGRRLEQVGSALDSTGPKALAARVGVGSQVASAIPPQNEVDALSQGLSQTDPTMSGGFEESLSPEESFIQQLIDAGMVEGVAPPQGAEGATQPGRLSQADIEQAILLDLQETGGKNLDKIQEVATLLGPQSESAGLNVTKPTQEDYTNAVTGMEALQQLFSLIETDPGIVQRTRTPGRGINTLGIGSEIRKRSGTAEFDTLGFQAVENLLRIQTGAAAPEQEVRRYMSQYLPQASDSEQTRNLKLQRMASFFQNVLKLANSPAASTGTSQEDALVQALQQAGVR